MKKFMAAALAVVVLLTSAEPILYATSLPNKPIGPRPDAARVAIPVPDAIFAQSAAPIAAKLSSFPGSASPNLDALSPAGPTPDSTISAEPGNAAATTPTPMLGSATAQASSSRGNHAALKSRTPAQAFPLAALKKFPRALRVSWRSWFDGAAPTPEEAALERDLSTLTDRLRLVEAHYLSPSKNNSSTPDSSDALRAAKSLSQSALEQLRLAADRPKPAKNWRTWIETGLTWFLGELREKFDFKSTFIEIKKKALVEGRNFLIYALAVEGMEDIVAPIILYLIGYPELIPLALACHTEPVTWPLYFVVRLYLWRRKLWRLAGGRSNYLRLKDFRARLMNEDPGKRLERVFLRGFPSLSERKKVTLNVNRSKLPVWVPLFLRNLYEYDFRWYDLYISINELAILAPSDLVRPLRRHYKEHPRAVAYTLIQSILDGPEEIKAGFIQNLAFKYWLNLGFDDLQPTLLGFLDRSERDITEKNRAFASRLLLLTTDSEKSAIKSMVADIYALCAVRRATNIPPGRLLEVMAPFLPDSYPRKNLTRGRFSSSPWALARTHFLLSFMKEQGMLKEGDDITLGGRPVAVISGSRLEYVGSVASKMEKALKRYGASLRGAREFLRQYREEVSQEPFAFDPDPQAALALSDSVSAGAPQLLLNIYWLKQSMLEQQISRLTQLKENTAPTLSGFRHRWAYKRDMEGQIGRLRGMERRLEKLEFLWLKAYYDHRFVRGESEVDGYADLVQQSHEIETDIQAAGMIGESLSRRAAESAQKTRTASH